jgi:hypothetical protein
MDRWMEDQRLLLAVLVRSGKKQARLLDDHSTVESELGSV